MSAALKAEIDEKMPVLRALQEEIRELRKRKRELEEVERAEEDEALEAVEALEADEAVEAAGWTAEEARASPVSRFHPPAPPHAREAPLPRVARRNPRLKNTLV